MNIYDIAKKAGVSAATVSRVINGSGSVSERSRKKVEKVMDQEGYTPNVFARGLMMKSVRTVGILCPVISDLNHAVPVSHLERLLRQNGFDTLLVCAAGYDDDKGPLLDLLLKKRVDAIVVIGSTVKESREVGPFAAAARRVPLVILNGLVKCENVYCVLCDEEAAARECVRLLHRQGCEDIAYLYDTLTWCGHQKLTGYRKGLAECGLAERPRLELKIRTDVNGIDASHAATTRLLDSGARVSALMTADDIIAVGAQKALAQRGLQLPIISFNNSRIAECSTPEITSVDNMVEALCVTAIAQLMDVLKGKNVGDRVVVSAKLIERETFRSSGG
jgi:LacI family transcriptional regulator/LacI family asc operon transcriptional repressor